MKLIRAHYENGEVITEWAEGVVSAIVARYMDKEQDGNGRCICIEFPEAQLVRAFRGHAKICKVYIGNDESRRIEFAVLDSYRRYKLFRTVYTPGMFDVVS